MTSTHSKADLVVIGGGLAGSEAAWQAARRGLRVDLLEMRPGTPTGAHVTANLAELVCSNSLGSSLPDRAGGVLKNELRKMGSLLIECAGQTALPSGEALAVDRDKFAALVTEQLASHPNIRILREEARAIPDGPAVIASGPLTSTALSAAIGEFTGRDHLFFYDAIAPVIAYESVDFEIAFRGSRYRHGDQEDGDYINCPFTREQYEHFVAELVSAERIRLHEFESDITARGVKAGLEHFFEGCLPVEVMAERHPQSLAFGPMRPVGLFNPHASKRPFAVLQLRQDNLAGSLYNLVGFQTNLTFPEQRRVFRMIPGLEKAEFARYGQMHRNTFIFSPDHLLPTLQSKKRADLFFAGQITGVEGYAGNIATGLLAGVNAARVLGGREAVSLPAESMLGALCRYITEASPRDFQPMKANFGIMPELTGEDGKLRGKRYRAGAFSRRAAEALETILPAILE